VLWYYWLAERKSNPMKTSAIFPIYPFILKSNNLFWTKPAVINSILATRAATWRTRWNIMWSLILFHWPHYVKKMTSSTKLKVHNVLHCHQKRTEPWPNVTSTENFVKFGHVVSRYASGQTCTQTSKQTD